MFAMLTTMKSADTESIRQQYGRGGLLESWGDLRSGDEKYARTFFESVRETKLLPENLDGFVFLSVSANKGSKEIAVAKLVDEMLAGKTFQRKPLFIAADLFGRTDRAGNFLPGFDPQLQPELNSIAFQFLSAKAQEIPLAKRSVDLIFDRMGALWHAVDSAVSVGPDEPVPPWQKKAARAQVESLLAEYHRKLKPGAAVIIDAPEGWAALGVTTTNVYLKQIYDDLPRDLAKIKGKWDRPSRRRIYYHFDVSLLGSGDGRLLVFRKKPISLEAEAPAKTSD